MVRICAPLVLVDSGSRTIWRHFLLGQKKIILALPHFAFPFFSYYFIIMIYIYFRRLCYKELEGCKRTVWNWKVWKRLSQDLLFKSVEMC